MKWRSHKVVIVNLLAVSPCLNMSRFMLTKADSKREAHTEETQNVWLSNKASKLIYNINLIKFY